MSSGGSNYHIIGQSFMKIDVGYSKHGNPHQYSCLENSMDWEAPQSLVGYSPWGREELDTTEWLRFTLTTQSLRKKRLRWLRQRNVGKKSLSLSPPPGSRTPFSLRAPDSLSTYLRINSLTTTKSGLFQGCKDSSIYANQSMRNTILTNRKIKNIWSS